MRVPSSPITLWLGHCDRIRARMRASDWRSASVTRATSPLYSILTRASKYFISKAPASRAIAAMAGTNSEEFEFGDMNTQLLLFIPKPSTYVARALLPANRCHPHSKNRGFLRFAQDFA